MDGKEFRARRKAREAMGSRFKNARLSMGLSEKEVCESLQIDDYTLVAVEYGIITPSASLINMFADLCDVSVQFLETGQVTSLQDEFAKWIDAPEFVKVGIMQKWASKE